MVCALDVRRCGKLVDAIGPGVEAPNRAPDRATFAGGVRSLENEHRGLTLFVRLAAEFTQFRLQFLFLLRVLSVSKPDGQVKVVKNGQRL